jgi:hypothetical protein
MPVLDTPDAFEAADFFANLVRSYGPDGAISYTYDQVAATLRRAWRRPECCASSCRGTISSMR